MTTFYLVRHGQNDRKPGDQPLNEVGRVQAQSTARHLSGLRVDAIYTSPLARAKQTAETIAAVLGLPAVEDKHLRERANFGDLPGQTLEAFLAMWQWCDEDRDYQPQIGLAARANGDRLDAWMRSIYEQYPCGTIVAASHGGTISDFLLNVFTREELERYLPDSLHNFDNCSITILHFDGERFKLEDLASTKHLIDR